MKGSCFNWFMIEQPKKKFTEKFVLQEHKQLGIVNLISVKSLLWYYAENFNIATMSHIMEKTLASIPKLLSQSLIGGGGSKMQQRQTPPMEVQNFMKIVHRARSKTHETHIINMELSNIQKKLKEVDCGSGSFLVVVRNSLTKALFCHLLGYNVTFIAIEAMKLANQGHGYDKRLGYLMSCLILGPHHEMVLLMMSTILRDISSSNMSDNCVGLKAAGELVDVETIPLFLADIIKKLNHQHDLVKEKAIHCFGSFHRKSHELLVSDIERLNVFLASRDPGVLMAVMNIFVMLTSGNPSQFIGLGSSFLHILHQINNRGFGSNYYYHMVPLPWLQISLLKVLGNIGHVDSQLSAKMCPLLKTLIEKTKVSVPISLAVLVECIITATKIQPNEALLQLCSRCIMKLLASDSNEDMRYQGLGLLIALSRIKQSFVSQHQVAIVECLTNEDHAIQSRTTLLLHAMANRANVKAICSKLFEQLTNMKELNFQQDILAMISDLAEKFFPNIDWYISTNLSILSYELPQLIKDKIVDLVLRKVKDISEPNQLIDNSSIDHLTETLFTILEKNNYWLAEFSLAIQLLGTLAPILSEEFSSERFLNIVSECLCSLDDKNVFMNNTNVCRMYSPDHFSDKNKIETKSEKSLIKLKSQCVMTVTKMVLYDCIQPSAVLTWLEAINYKTTIHNSFIRNDLIELDDLARNPNDLKLKSVIFYQNNLEVDYSLSFLDSFVVKDMLNGNECYKPSYVRKPVVPLLQSSSLSSTVVDEKGGNVDNSIMSESVTSQAKKKVPSKWRDDNAIDENEWNITGESEYSERFVLVDSDDKHLEDFNKKKKDAEELFAGLDEMSFDISTESSLTNSSLSVVETKRTKTIWDDDDDDCDKNHRIFNVGHINPFGISKKPKVKPMKWTEDFKDEKLSNVGFLNNNNNNNNDKNDNKFQDSLYASSFEPPNSSHHSKSSDEPWSDYRENLSMVEEVVPSLYSSPNIDSGSESLLGSTVDALTDSDPETTDN